MIMEKVKEIKSAEEKADAIIKSAEGKAAGGAFSLESKINDLNNAKEKQLSAEMKQYREISDKKTENRINALKQEYLHKLAGIKEKSERKIAVSVDSVWKELKNSLSMP